MQILKIAKEKEKIKNRHICQFIIKLKLEGENNISTLAEIN